MAFSPTFLHLKPRLNHESQSHIWFARFLPLVLLYPGLASAGDSTQLRLERQFTSTIRPFLESYCLTCHGQDKPKADFDLTPYSTMDAVAREPLHWELVLEKL